MEKSIENAIDNWLESISPGLYLFSIGLGIVLMILGAILFFTKKGSKGKKAISKRGLACLVIGMVAVVSGLIQM